MSYAQRPMGDYKTYGYAGDPGWLSGLFKIAKKIALPVLGGIIGGPIGAMMGAAPTGTKLAPLPTAYAPPAGTIGGAVSFPGGTTVSMARVPGAPSAVAAGGQPAGYHLDKATRSRWVRNRRMNVANPRALRKAMRRVQGFEKLAKRTITFTKRVRIKK